MKKSTIYLIRGIWIFLFILIPSVLNALSLQQGVQLGAAPTFLLYGVFLWLIVRTCKGKLDPKQKSVPAPQASGIESKPIEHDPQPSYKVTPHSVCKTKQEKEKKKIMPKDIIIIVLSFALAASLIFLAVRESSHKDQLQEQYHVGYDVGYVAGRISREEEITRLEEANEKLRKENSSSALDALLDGTENSESSGLDGLRKKYGLD